MIASMISGYLVIETASSTTLSAYAASLTISKILNERQHILAPRPGLEPGTCGLTVRRSTD